MKAWVRVALDTHAAAASQCMKIGLSVSDPLMATCNDVHGVTPQIFGAEVSEATARVTVASLQVCPAERR